MIERVAVAGSEVTISRIGLGCQRIYAGTETRKSARLIEGALSAGIRHFDTAPMYGDGQSEDVLGQVLRGVGDVTLTTKVGISRPNPEMARRTTMVGYRRFVHPLLTRFPGVKSQLKRVQASIWKDEWKPEAAPRRILTGSHIRQELQESLKRLKRDRIDLYLVHEPDQFDLDDQALETFLALRREGVVGAFGLAYGREVSEAPDFGTVLQSQCASQRGGQHGKKTQIFHGVLRHGWREFQSRAGGSPQVNRYVASLFDGNPNLAIIFSATTVSQIRQVTAPV